MSSVIVQALSGLTSGLSGSQRLYAKRQVSFLARIQLERFEAIAGSAEYP
jgi:hypothetical protein